MKKIVIVSITVVLLLTYDSGVFAKMVVDVKRDENMFTLFTLANASGYNIENLEHFSNARSIARCYILKFKDKCHITVYEFKRATRDDPYYSRAMSSILSDDAETEAYRKKINALLKDFEECAVLDVLNQQLEKEYDHGIKFYKSNAKNLIKFTLRTLNVPKAAYPKKIVIIPNPLDSHYRGYNANNSEVCYIIIGPGDDLNNLSTLVHELIHRYVDPIIFSSERDYSGIKETYDNVKEKYPFIGSAYPNLKIFLAENIVIGFETYVMSNYFEKDSSKLLNDYRREKYVYAFPFLQYLLNNKKKHNDVKLTINGFLKSQLELK